MGVATVSRRVPVRGRLEEAIISFGHRDHRHGPDARLAYKLPETMSIVLPTSGQMSTIGKNAASPPGKTAELRWLGGVTAHHDRTYDGNSTMPSSRAVLVRRLSAHRVPRQVAQALGDH